MLEETKWGKKYLTRQPIWYDSDMIKAAAYGIVIGFIVGVVVGYSLGFPDISTHQITFVRG